MNKEFSLFSENILNTAYHYARDFKWSVFPCHTIRNDGRCTCGKMLCKSAGKHPKTIKGTGLKEASSDIEEITRQFKTAGECNIAVRTGEASGFFVVDIDGSDGEKSISDLQEIHGALPTTLTHLTGSGRHLLFKWPGSFVPNSTSKIAHKIDIRGDGGYIVAAPSKHKSGRSYQFENWGTPIADAPQWLLDKLKKENKPAPLIDHERLAMPDFTPDDISDMLDHIPADDYETWYQIGMALHHEGLNFQVWNSWSSKSSKYTDAKDCMAHWRSFKNSGGGLVTIGSLVHMAQSYGWVPKSPGPDPRIEAMVAELIENERKKSQPETVTIEKPKKEKLDIAPHGLIADTVKWITSTAIKPQPELALMNTIAALGAVIGRKYATSWDTRVNMYVIGIAGTGAGKDHSRKQIKKLMARAHLARHLAGDGIVSDRGMLRGIQLNPEQILHLDEIGLMLQTITGANAASHLRGISKALLEMYSSSSSIYNSGSYASVDVEPIVIDSPHLCVYGTTTLESYTDALNSAAVKDGSLNRFLVMPTKEDHPKRRRDIASSEPPETLVERWRNLANSAAEHSGGGNLSEVQVPGGRAPTPKIVSWGDTLDRIHDMGDFEDQEMQSDASYGALWNRYRENCIKIAMVISVCRNPFSPTIEDTDLDYAERIVQSSIDFMKSIAEDHIADTVFEKQCNKVLAIIQETKKTGATRSHIMKRSKYKARDLTEILSSMSEAGRIYSDGDKETYVRWFAA